MKKVFLITLIATGLAACNQATTDTVEVSSDSTAVVTADTVPTVIDTVAVDTAK
jgi:hypothetical protein